MGNHESNAAHLDDEISLIEILCFLKRNARIILGFSILGILVAGLFLFVVSNQYEAVANIRMALVPADKNPLGVNVEEPQALIDRMSLPQSFGEEVLQDCQLSQPTLTSVQISKAIKFVIPKSIANIVELKVTRSSPELAGACAQSVFEAIAKSQNSLAEPARLRVQKQLTKVQERLAQDKVLLAKAEQSKDAVSSTYFALLRDTRDLEDEREGLSKVLDAKGWQTQLQSPIIFPSQPVFPKKVTTLAAGLVGGLLLGLLLALGKIMIANLKSQMQGVL